MNRLILYVAFFCAAIALNSCSSSRNAYVYKPRKKKSRKETVASKPHKKTSLRDEVILSASKYAGTRYVYGGKKPSSGFDCSGLVTHVYQNAGINVRGASRHLAKRGTYVSRTKVKPGDLVFFGTNEKVTHVSIVYSNKNNKIRVIHSTKSRGVVIDDIAAPYWTKRYLFSKDIISLEENTFVAAGGK